MSAGTEETLRCPEQNRGFASSFPSVLAISM